VSSSKSTSFVREPTSPDISQSPTAPGRVDTSSFVECVLPLPVSHSVLATRTQKASKASRSNSCSKKIHSIKRTHSNTKPSKVSRSISCMYVCVCVMIYIYIYIYISVCVWVHLQRNQGHRTFY
jgi:hypothetical protein